MGPGEAPREGKPRCTSPRKISLSPRSIQELVPVTIFHAWSRFSREEILAENCHHQIWFGKVDVFRSRQNATSRSSTQHFHGIKKRQRTGLPACLLQLTGHCIWRGHRVLGHQEAICHNHPNLPALSLYLLCSHRDVRGGLKRIRKK